MRDTLGFKLDPELRPKDWTAVAVPRRLVTSDQWISGQLGPLKAMTGEVPEGRLIIQRWQNLGTSEVGLGLGAGNGGRRVRERRVVCSR